MSRAEKYTPDEAELIGCYAGAMEEQAGENYGKAKADAERGIAKIKADALREAAQKLYVLAEDPRLVELDVRYGGYYTGVRSARKKQVQELLMEADRIGEEANG